MDGSKTKKATSSLHADSDDASTSDDGDNDDDSSDDSATCTSSPESDDDVDSVSSDDMFNTDADFARAFSTYDDPEKVERFRRLNLATPSVEEVMGEFTATATCDRAGTMDCIDDDDDLLVSPLHARREAQTTPRVEGGVLDLWY